MAMYKTCEHCGSNLDFGESCDCKGIAVAAAHNTAKKPATDVKHKQSYKSKRIRYATRHTAFCGRYS